MSFLSPLDLFWLVPIAGTIILLYLLKMRRQDFRVPATFLWPQTTSDIRANAPFQRLRFSILLLLQLLAATLIIIALASPLRPVKGIGGSATVLVLDDSASMQATDVFPSRFENDVARVKALVQSLGPTDHMALIVAGATTRVVFPLSSDKSLMLRELKTLLPSDAPINMGDAMRLASALVNNKSSARIIVYSDGIFPKVTDFSPGRATVTYIDAGTSYKNVAITAFNSSLTPKGALSCFAALHNFDSSMMNVGVTFTVDGNLTDARQVSIPASSTTTLVFSAPGNGRRADLAISSSGDILKADNNATIFLKGQGTVRTLLVTNGDLFLENALSLDPSIRLEKATDVPDYEVAGTSGAGRYDLVIFDNVTPKHVKSPAVWSFGIPAPQFGVDDDGMDLHPNVDDWSRTDPVMHYVDLTKLDVQTAHKVKLIAGSGANVLAQSADSPMIVSTQVGGYRTLYSTWSLLDSDFPLTVSFPIFVANSVDWLTTGRSRTALESGGITSTTGKIFTVATNDKDVVLTGPDGVVQPLESADGAVVIHNADRVGVYHLTGQHTNTTLAVNLLDENASDVRTRDVLDLAGSPLKESGNKGLTLSELWRPIICVVLLLLAGEWWLFVRRS